MSLTSARVCELARRTVYVFKGVTLGFHLGNGDGDTPGVCACGCAVGVASVGVYVVLACPLGARSYVSGRLLVVRVGGR